ncbi:Esterase [Saliniradius amylolyticus]|uniref:Esterase n=1 Tax=Saliniradius amylolyticus TaxID=2183582 RepID=A0A2S2E3F3_9ALTE|nr:alpha/beta fold hydrolase [Saliniradius amylolyticus]AWL12129.1 Esterase [Saliniradius amylolyticus]
MLNYQRAGNGPTLVLLHGLFGSLENLNSIKRALEDSFDVLSLDLPDHGDSPRSERFSYAHYVQQVIELLDSLNIRQCSVLGHSMGGKVAMQLALHHPERVDKLLVADIAPVAYSARHDTVFDGLNAVELDGLKSRTQADKQMAEYIREPGVRQFLLKSLSKTDHGWQWKFNLPLLERDYKAITGWPETQRTFDGPTLFIKGGDSDYITADHQGTIGDHFHAARGKILQGTGHWLHAEKPAAFNKIVQDFLDGD